MSFQFDFDDDVDNRLKPGGRGSAPVNPLLLAKPLQMPATDCDKQNSGDDDDVDHNHDDGGLEFG